MSRHTLFWHCSVRDDSSSEHERQTKQNSGDEPEPAKMASEVDITKNASKPSNVADIPVVVVKAAASSLAGKTPVSPWDHLKNYFVLLLGTLGLGRRTHNPTTETTADVPDMFKYTISFTMDCDCPCRVIIHHFAYEDSDSGRLVLIV